jgi:hypothetical protein
MAKVCPKLFVKSFLNTFRTVGNTTIILASFRISTLNNNVFSA